MSIEYCGMADINHSFERSLADLSKNDWLKAVQRFCKTEGTFEKLGNRHYSAFLQRNETLLVTFETLQGIRILSADAQPLGWDMVKAHNWSHLCIASDGDTWFRDRAVYSHFDRLIDDGFFDAFEQVIFYGAGPCGYAAAAYSVSAPGCAVLAVQPQATLDPRVAEWDDRFAELRRVDFTNRYGYAPDMIDGAERAYVLYDPAEHLDAMHAALFTRPNVKKFRLRFMGNAIQTDLLEMDIWESLLLAIRDDQLDDLYFGKCLRMRRTHPLYLRNLMAVLDAAGRDFLLKALIRNVTSRMHAPRFARRLAQLKASEDS